MPICLVLMPISDARVSVFPTRGSRFYEIFVPPQPTPQHCIYFYNPHRPPPATIKIDILGICNVIKKRLYFSLKVLGNSH